MLFRHPLVRRQLNIFTVIQRSAWLSIKPTAAYRLTFASELRARHQKYILYWVILLLVTTIISNQSAGTEFTFEFERGHWAGKAEVSEAGAVEACTLSLHNDQSEYLLLRLDQERSLLLGVSDKNWKATAPGVIRIIILVDHALVYSGQAILITDSFITLEVPRPMNALTHIAKGRALMILHNDDKTVFRLEFAATAIDFLIKCLNWKAS